MSLLTWLVCAASTLLQRSASFFSAHLSTTAAPLRSWTVKPEASVDSTRPPNSSTVSSSCDLL